MKILQTVMDAGEALSKPGTVGILPTDTIYGLVARAADRAAVERLYALKNREQKPGTLIAATSNQLVDLGIPRRYIMPVVHYWPNPISIVIPTAPGLTYLDLGRFSLAVRIPADDTLQKLLVQTGPLLTSSANYPGESPAKNAQEAKGYFGDAVDFYVDGGDIDNPASTVIRVVDDAVEVLREGAVKISESGEIL